MIGLRREQRLARRRSGGFTLIEVLLVTALSAVLLGMISMAVYINVRVVQRQQANIEKTQVARSVLFMVSRDLRGAFQYKPADVTGLDALTVSQEAIAAVAGGVDPSTLGDAAGLLDSAGGPGGLAGLEGLAGGGITGGPAGNQAGASDGAETEQPGIGTQQTEVLRPGLYGTRDQLMIDVSRLPRIDQYEPLVVGDQAATQLPSDIKTVSYYLSDQSEQSTNLQIGLDAAQAGGLYRRELDRAVASFSPDVAAALATLGNTQLISKEVVGLQFRYFDGEEWAEEWNSDDMGGFPAAVEVVIVVDVQAAGRENNGRQLQSELPNNNSSQIFRSVINLPVAEILDEESDQAGAGTGG